jgi:hypothetical protein
LAPALVLRVRFVESPRDQPACSCVAFGPGAAMLLLLLLLLLLPSPLSAEPPGASPPPPAAAAAAAAAAALLPATPCTGVNKQKALYLEYDIQPSLAVDPATDISVEHMYTSTQHLKSYGKNGVFASQPIHTADGPSGYFGSQVTPDKGTLLFSLWDAQLDRHPNASTLARCDSGVAGPNRTWCLHKHSFPLSPNCHRHCLDCGLHPGWHNTSGTQCSVTLDDGIADGESFKFRLYRAAAYGSTLTPPAADGCGLSYTGSIWQLDAVRFDPSGTEVKTYTVGKVFLEETQGGIVRFSAFHEHIGCTPCDAFFESEVRRGPWINAPNKRTVASVGFSAPAAECRLFNVTLLSDKISARISTGPGTFTPPDGAAV